MELTKNQQQVIDLVKEMSAVEVLSLANSFAYLFITFNGAYSSPFAYRTTTDPSSSSKAIVSYQACSRAFLKSLLRTTLNFHSAPNTSLRILVESSTGIALC